MSRLKHHSVVLVGPAGVGKTAIAKSLVYDVNIDFYDLDELIEIHTNQAITDIFATQGESFFRKIESDFLSRNINNSGVLSTGGGIVATDRNRTTLKSHPCVVWLDAAPSILLERIRTAQHRPLLNNTDKLAKLRELDTERRLFYCEVATYHVNTGHQPIHKVKQIVASMVCEQE